MRFLLGLFCIFALGVVPLVGCSETAGGGGTGGSAGSGGTAGDGGSGGVGGDPSCALRPLDDYCEGASCPTWEQAIAAAEELAQQSGYCDQQEGQPISWAGRCGDHRYVRTGTIYENGAEYFDASGALVAYSDWYDGCVCPPSCAVDYGLDLKCEEEIEQDFCEAPP